MPRFDPVRVHAAVIRASTLLGKRRPPATYPEDFPRRLQGAKGAELAATLVNARDAADSLLRDALDAEQRARAAQEAAIEALRHLGGMSPGWRAIGAVLGIGGQGAHKRFRHVEAPPAQTTIDDALQAAEE